MNTLKYRPVGRPSGPVIRVRVSQCRRAIEGNLLRPPKALSVRRANRVMLAKGFIRAGVRHG